MQINRKEAGEDFRVWERRVAPQVTDILNKGMAVDCAEATNSQLGNGTVLSGDFSSTGSGCSHKARSIC